MCDYSLLGMPTRLATQGEELVVHRFLTHSIGLASPADLEVTAKEPRGQSRKSIWLAVKRWFESGLKTPTCAICIPPGARLVLRDIPERLQREVGVKEEEEVVFVQQSANPYSYRDAVRFSNGAEVLLQRLEEGQRVDVLCLSSVEEESWDLLKVTA
jgi:hypothetical protein